MSLETAIDRLMQLILAQGRKSPRMVERHYGVIVSVANDACYAQLDGNSTSVGPLQYSGSVAPPNPGESWAFDVIQREWIAVFRLNAGEGKTPAYDGVGSAQAAQAAAEVHADFLLTAAWSVPGIVPASTSAAVCPPHIVFGAMRNATMIYMDLAVAVPDASNAVTWEFIYTPAGQTYANQTATWSITLPAGASLVSQEVPCYGFGAPGASIVGYVVSYAGSVASGLGAHFRVR